MRKNDMNTLDGIRKERDQERALRLALATPNCDPLDLIVARESAAEVLDGYLDHVKLNRAARRIIAAVSGRES